MYNSNMDGFIHVYTDGGARGNPGDAAIGVYITDSSNKEIAGFGKKIGFSTNNVAEYTAVLEALDWIIKNKKQVRFVKKKLNITKAFFFLDSLLVYSQIVGLYKVKNSNLRSLLFSIREKETEAGLPIFYKHIPREQNKKADTYVNKALDNKV